MERTKNKKPVWVKITQGTLYPFPRQMNRRVKFKETIEATAEELGNKINQFELVEDGTGKYKVSEAAKATVEEPKEAAEEPTTPEKDEYSVESAGPGWYNVVSSSGKVMNEKKLRADKAEALKDELEAEQVEE